MASWPSLATPPPVTRPQSPWLHRPAGRSVTGRPAIPSVTCGPRDNRGKLLRGRTLSTEAILAVQALKRASAAGNERRVDAVVAHDLSRLVKADLLAALAELQRQDHWRLALKAFAAARREPWYKAADLALYAEMVSTLSRCGAAEQIDALVAELLEEKGKEGGFSPRDDIRGLNKLLRALMAAERGKLVADVYRGMKRGQCEIDEFLFRFVMRGLRRLGEEDAADEVARDFEVWDENGDFGPEMRLPVR